MHMYENKCIRRGYIFDQAMERNMNHMNSAIMRRRTCVKYLCKNKYIYIYNHISVLYKYYVANVSLVFGINFSACTFYNRYIDAKEKQ